MNAPPPSATQIAVKGLADKVLLYFREFLETDFKRQAAPRRRIQFKTQAGYRSAIDLRKYPAFFKDVWLLAAKPPQEMKLTLGQKKYKAQISPVLKNLIQQFVDQLPEQGFADVRADIVRHVADHRVKGAENPERYVDEAITRFAEMTAAQIVHPLLTLLEGPFKQAAYSAEDSVFEVESDLTDALCLPAAEQMAPAINTLLLSGNSEPLQAGMAEFFTLVAVKSQMMEFFESFAAADAYQEVRDVLNYMRSDDTLTTYLYFGAIKFGANDFPLFYLPVTLALEAEGSGYVMSAEPKLYIHKRAIEFVVSELKRDAERVSVAVIPERIVHLTDEETAHKRMLTTMRELTRTLDIAGEIDVNESRPQIARSPQLRISNAAYLAVFDRSDESLVNDYEALLSSLEANHVEAASMFQGIVHSMLFDDPKSVSAEVRADWQALSTSGRLVTNSPIPLNEEQIRIDCARRKPGCRFIAVEGPPGTGKSHTITALAFNAIIEHKSVLIISDKNEALDVVQDKLEQALQAVRSGDDFPNPILRLGKDGTYRGLMSGASRGRILTHHQAQSANMPAVEKELTQETERLSTRIDQTVTAMTQVDLADISRVHELEKRVEALTPGLAAELTRRLRGTPGGSLKLTQAVLAFNALTAQAKADLSQAVAGEPSMAALLQRLRVHAVAQAIESSGSQVGQLDRAALRLFTPMAASKSGMLMALIAKIEALRRPLIGMMFRGSRLAQLDLEISRALPCPNPVGLSRKLVELKAVVRGLGVIGQNASDLALPDDSTNAVYALLARAEPKLEGAGAAFDMLQALLPITDGLPIWLARFTATGGVGSVALGTAIDPAVLIAEYLVIFDRLSQRFASIPSVDFVREKGRLETLNTSRLAHQLDSRFLKFAEENRATAAALGGVIKQRAQFPTDQFKTLRDAFPCVIVGIREFGEFVPLKTEVFDLLIIDEGSQVSVAQAMPAMLRAKQVVVFGDRRQFSNVKSHNASNVTNAGYLSDLQDHFRANISSAADKIDRLQRFDVKKSILDFIGLLANHTEMLRKHFRGYPELISYSSKNFYDGQLQAIKIRPVPVDDVLRFEVLAHDGRAEAKPNTNSVEAARIMEMLVELLEGEEGDAPPSVGIITPHREQAVLIGALVMRHPDGERFEKDLRLKVMTFDTCQGEERDVIIYSFVATRERDVLNYVFPVQLTDGGEDAEESMKAQRLNVGFSRAKECMVFVMSKPPEEFKGTIAKALLHYQRVLNDRSVAAEQDTDAASPMEKRVLGWLKATPFMQNEAERIELIAQFPVGDYLRQLDPTYKHAAYKVDFLLRHFGAETTSNVIIEYDGFSEHFTHRDRVNAGNYERYYKPEDVERQFVLESYGYRFLRVNRFNLGDDPVATLNARLGAMIEAIGGADDAASVGRIKLQAQALEDGQSKVCTRCKIIKPLADYFDRSLASGTGGHGRVCMACKAPTRPAAATSVYSGHRGFHGGRRFKRY